MSRRSGAATRVAGSALADYDYELPPERIAQYPADRRDESRLLVVPRKDSPLRHGRFRDLVDLLRPGDVVVLNESRVIPARLLGVKPTGAPSEILLLRPRDDASTWEALVRPGSKLKPGRIVRIAPELTVEILDSLPGGGRVVRLVTGLAPREAIERFGHVPLPPYIARADEPLDRERYQTVYARVSGSVAAPTAGLHFTPQLLADLGSRGVHVARIVLHVGIGTFRPVESEDLGAHRMHREAFSVPSEAAATIEGARRDGGRVWAVGTTVARTLETVAEVDGSISAVTGETDLFIRPGHSFRAIDALVTNFHLPRSTLLMLVAAFAGFERTMDAYLEAMRGGYRFYSYGDAMVVV